jgi:hypothetical protein
VRGQALRLLEMERLHHVPQRPVVADTATVILDRRRVLCEMDESA